MHTRLPAMYTYLKGRSNVLEVSSRDKSKARGTALNGVLPTLVGEGDAGGGPKTIVVYLCYFASLVVFLFSNLKLFIFCPLLRIGRAQIAHLITVHHF